MTRRYYYLTDLGEPHELANVDKWIDWRDANKERLCVRRTDLGDGRVVETEFFGFCDRLYDTATRDGAGLVLAHRQSATREEADQIHREMVQRDWDKIDSWRFDSKDEVAE